jgi:glutaredoxin
MDSRNSYSETNTAKTGTSAQGNSIVGVICLWAGAVLGLLLFGEKLGGLPFSMPASWYTSPSIWLFLALLLSGTGIKLMGNSKPVEQIWTPSQKYPRFDNITIYTREECHLCEDAEILLAKYYEFIPVPEIIDIDEDDELKEEFGDCVPVIEIDGKVRFRGKIDETLLKRLIENAPVSNLPIIE